MVDGALYNMVMSLKRKVAKMDHSLVPAGYARRFYEHDLPSLVKAVTLVCAELNAFNANQVIVKEEHIHLVKELQRFNDNQESFKGLKILLGLTATETLVRAGKSPDDARAFIAELIGTELPEL